MSHGEQERPHHHLDEGRPATVQSQAHRVQPADPGDIQPAEGGLRDVPVLRIKGRTGGPGVVGA